MLLDNYKFNDYKKGEFDELFKSVVNGSGESENDLFDDIYQLKVLDDDIIDKYRIVLTAYVSQNGFAATVLDLERFDNIFILYYAVMDNNNRENRPSHYINNLSGAVELYEKMDELKAVFREIKENIIKEVIRLSKENK